MAAVAPVRSAWRWIPAVVLPPADSRPQAAPAHSLTLAIWTRPVPAPSDSPLSAQLPDHDWEPLLPEYETASKLSRKVSVEAAIAGPRRIVTIPTQATTASSADEYLRGVRAINSCCLCPSAHQLVVSAQRGSPQISCPHG